MGSQAKLFFGSRNIPLAAEHYCGLYYLIVVSTDLRGDLMYL
jgi:hypothetical protein